jgi:hypothetical protein
LNKLISLAIKKGDKIFHEKTSFMRVTPNFLIIGNSFCCKTLLYDYMTQHHLIMKNLREETAFWGWHYNKGIMWYKSNFPTKIYKKILEFIHKKEAHVGETINMFGLERPEQIHKIIPNPKIIVILRNPIDRAFARYLADVRAKLEKRTFEDSIEKPRDRNFQVQKIKMNKIKNVDDDESLYIANSIYSYDLKRWNEFFPIEKMLFLSSEDLIKNPLVTVNKALKFLELKPLKTIKKIGQNWEENQGTMESKMRQELQKIFEPHNQDLFELVGEKFDWK